jgi:hypothetical protein
VLTFLYRTDSLGQTFIVLSAETACSCVAFLLPCWLPF